MNKHLLLIVLIVSISVALILIVPRPDSSQSKKALPPDTWNVILIQADTLRADHLGAYGYARAQTPNLDALAAKGVLFEQHIVNATYTACSVPSLLTGNYQDRHGLWFQGDTLSESNITFPERLSKSGYVTTGFFSNPVVHPDRGYTQGVETTLNLTRDHDAGVMVNHALDWLQKNRDDPFFLWLFLIDPHFPYTPPTEYADRFAQPGSLKTSLSWQWEFDHDNVQWDMEALLWGDLATPDSVALEMVLYDAEISFLDAQVGRLLDYLEQEGLTENTVIVFTSDHGEEFHEHTFFCSHGHSTYDSVASVPLIIKTPESTPSRVSQVVRNIDVAPTILELLGIAYENNIDGRSLAELVQGKQDSLPLIPAYSTSGPIHQGFFRAQPRIYLDGVEGAWRSVRTEQWKLIRIPHPETDIYELYDLKADPGETRNLYDPAHEKVAELTGMLNSIEARVDQDSSVIPVQGELDEETTEMLESLGYIGQ